MAAIDETVATLLQAALVVLVSLWAANWASARIRSAAKARDADRDAASVISRLVALLVYGIAAAMLLSIFGASATAVAAIFGATFGISLALQDVAKGFVNGLYVLLERPYRIGDTIRVGAAAGQVEEIGVRLTRLRAVNGDRVLLPNTLVFTSIIHNATSGKLDRQRFRLTGVKQPVSSLERAVIEALRGTAHLSSRKPIVQVIEVSPAGATLEVTVESDLGHRVDNAVLDRLLTAFPESTASTAVPADSA